MRSYLNITTSILRFIAEKFPEVTCQVKQTDYKGIIHTFFLHFPTSESLEKAWEPLYNAIAFHYQSRIESEFERWNFYLFYLVETPVDRSLKFRIENDPISSRKIVLEKFKGTLTDKKIKTIIDEHITNRNLQVKVASITSSNKQAVVFPKNPLLMKAISQMPLSGKKRGGEEETTTILKTIEQLLADEVQKS